MKKFFFYVLVLGLIPGFVSAQSNFKPGYVVSGMDTLKGFIDYRGWQKNPEAISFKKDLRSEAETKYTPAQIKAFAVTGLEYYNSFTVNISRAQVDLAYIKQGADTSYTTKTVFLHLLSAGKNISLFDYTDDIKTRYYILDAQSTLPRELIYQVFYSMQDLTQVQTAYTYRNQLEFFAIKYHAKTPGLDHQIEVSPYSESYLVKIARAINQDSTKQFTPKSRFGLGWVVSAAINANSLAFPLYLDYPYNTTLFPKVSVGIDLFPNINTQKVFVRCDLSFTQSTHSFSRSLDSTGFTHYSSSISNLVQSNFTLAPQVVFNLYNSAALQVFVDAGVGVNFSFYNNYYLAQSEANTVYQRQYKFPDLDALWINIPFKAGIALNRKIEIYASYAPPVMITPSYSGIPGHEYEYGAGVGYRFGVK